jgi:predicted porin
MKKSLIALAVLSTIAGSVAAQSSVSVYGRLDAGYKAYETTTTGGVSTKSDQISNNAFTTSRLGVMGTEDLGGGLKAGFMIEGNVAIAPGTTASDSTTAFNFGRQQFLTLSSASAGTLLVGKTDAIVKQVFDSYDAGYSNNLVGAYDGMANGAEFSGTTATANVIGNRRDAVIRYTSPKFSNANVSVGLIKNSVKDSDKDIATDDSGYEAGLTYAAGALSFAAAYRSVDVKNPKTASTGLFGADTTPVATDVAPSVTSLGVAQVAKADGTTDSTAVGVSYNFGSVVGFAQYFDQDATANLTSVKTAEDAFTIGVRVPMGKSTLFASYTDGDRTVGTAKTAFEGMQVGVKYDLSKRTYGYVAYGEAEKQATGAAKSKADNLAFGVAHSF